MGQRPNVIIIRLPFSTLNHSRINEYLHSVFWLLPLNDTNKIDTLLIYSCLLSVLDAIRNFRTVDDEKEMSALTIIIVPCVS